MPIEPNSLSGTDSAENMRYLGASLRGLETGYLIENFGWNVGFYFWIF